MVFTPVPEDSVPKFNQGLLLRKMSHCHIDIHMHRFRYTCDRVSTELAHILDTVVDRNFDGMELTDDELLEFVRSNSLKVSCHVQSPY